MELDLTDGARRDHAATCLSDGRAVVPAPADRRPRTSSNGPHYTYDDVPPGETDYDLSHFSIAHDQAQILPLLRQALALNPSLKVMATPWSPPAWMKTNDSSLIGGRLIDDPAIYQAYADYLVKFVQAYQARRRADLRV